MKRSDEERERSSRWGQRAVWVSTLVGVGLIFFLVWPELRSRPHRAPAATGEPSGEFAKAVRAVRTHSGAGPGRISGTVSDPSGAAVDRVDVCATEAERDLLAATAVCTRSDERGRFQLEELRPGPYLVAGQRAGYRSTAAEDGEPLWVLEGRSRSVHLTLLASEANLVGTVVDALGGPVPGATIRVARSEAPEMNLITEADEEGRFALNLPEGWVELGAEAAGYAHALSNAIVPAAVDLVLIPGGRLEGTVQQADGTPVEGATVRALGVEPRMALGPATAVSDGEGRFALDGLAPNAYRLQAQGPHGFALHASPIELGLGETARGLVLTLEPATTVTGSVALAAGGPCPRGTVSLGGVPDPNAPLPPAFIESDYKPSRVPATTERIGAAGAVVFPGVPQGRYYVSIRCTDHVYAAGPLVLDLSAGQAQIAPLRWEVKPSSVLIVHVVDGSGRPVPQTDLVLRLPPRGPGGERGLMPFRTGADGVARLTQLMSGRYEIVPSDPSQGEPVQVALQNDTASEEITLRLRGSAALTVEVVDQSDAPQEGLSVLVRRLATTADEARPSAVAGSTLAPLQRAVALGRGRYRLAPLLAGTYEVIAADGKNPIGQRHGSKSTCEVSRGTDARMRLRLSRTAHIAGRVVDSEGVPLEDVWVEARAEQDMGESQRAMAGMRPGTGAALTDQDGRFRLEGLSPGAVFSLNAHQPYGSAVHQQGVLADQSVELVLPDTAQLEGRVEAPSGEPAPLAAVFALAAHGAVRRTAQLFDGGRRFYFEALPASDVQLMALGAAGERAQAAVTLRPGQQPRVVTLKWPAVAKVDAPSDRQ